MRATLPYLLTTIIISAFVFGSIGCANIIPPTGGPRDSLPPMLISATPPDSSRNVKPNRVILTFNEYVDQLQDVTQNVIISPTLPNIPTITSRLRTITIRLTDTLEPNTTYSINFGKAIRDVNEGNVLENFTYIFSTGGTIDANTLSGKVVLAETGKTDSTLIAVLHQDISDSAVIKQRPRYYSKLDSAGNFTFYNLPEGQFAVYVVENDYLKRYDDSTKLFAFLNSPVTVSANTSAVTLYAYREAERKAPAGSGGSSGTNPRNQDRRLRYSNAEGSSKDVLTPLYLDFSRKLKLFDSTKFILTDTSFNRIANYRTMLDSNKTRVTIQHAWRLSAVYKLIIQKDAVSDAEGVNLPKADTLTLTAKDAEDYGQVRLRFNNIDLTKSPVLQIVQNDVVIDSVPLTGREWKRNLFKPGEYDLRILFDANKNGTWDPGNFKAKRQPEIVQSLPRKLSIRANWENEVDINL